MENVKTCTGCKSPFPSTREFFHGNGSQSSGLHTKCKGCVKTENKSNWKKKRIAAASKTQGELVGKVVLVRHGKMRRTFSVVGTGQWGGRFIYRCMEHIGSNKVAKKCGTTMLHGCKIIGECEIERPSEPSNDEECELLARTVESEPEPDNIRDHMKGKIVRILDINGVPYVVTVVRLMFSAGHAVYCCKYLNDPRGKIRMVPPKVMKNAVIIQDAATC